MPQNQSALINAALADVTVLGAGQSPSQENVASAAPRIGPILADLASRRVTPTVDPNAIPDSLFPDLVRIVAQRIAYQFGRTPDLAVMQDAEARLRELFRLDRSQGTALARQVLDRLQTLGALTDAVDLAAVSDAIPQVLEDLAVRRVITIANEQALTLGTTPHVVTLVAARCNPAAVPADAIAAAEEGLRRISRLSQATDPLVLGILEQLELYQGGTNVLDAAAITRRLPGILGELAARDVIYLQADSVPDAAVPDLTRYIAASLANPQLMPIMRDAETRLRRMQAQPYLYEPVQVSYF